ncbi:hypothetical protein BGZ46_008054 [Entomortierella lignicola]|nr:hypothetical protein BGZ46_008054 [Entomortierella lignicola]
MDRRFQRNLYYRELPESPIENSIDIYSYLSGLAVEGQLKVRDHNLLLPTLPRSKLLLLLDITGPLLTELVLNLEVTTYIPLDQIIGLCPNILNLKLESLSGTLDQNQYQEYRYTQLPYCLPLQSLALCYVLVDPDTLLRVLESSPKLEELRLIKPVPYSRPVTGITNQFRWHFDDSFLREVARCCPKLKVAHISDDRTLSGPDYRGSELSFSKLLSFFPMIRHWGLPSIDLNSAMFVSMRNHTNTVTSLEILGAKSFENATTNHLHEFLCNSPQLLHLKAPYVEFPVHYFDLEGTLDWIAWNHEEHQRYNRLNRFSRLKLPYSSISTMPTSNDVLSSSLRRKIWACRNLKTLHLSFFGRCLLKVSREGRARVIFGYISRVCPRLQDLAIRKEMYFSLEAGLCLLTRLQELRSLKISATWDSWDVIGNVDWIPRDMSQSLRVEMASWTKLNTMESGTLYATSPFRSSTNAMDPRTMTEYVYSADDEHTDDHIIDGVDMRYLGRLKDLALYFRDRVFKNMPCWPHLEYIELHDLVKGYNDESRMINMAKTIQEHRPDIEVRCILNK